MSKSTSLILFAPVVLVAVPVLLLAGILGGMLVLPVAIAGSLIDKQIESASVVAVAIATEVIDAPIQLASVVAVEGGSLVSVRPTQVLPVS